MKQRNPENKPVFQEDKRITCVLCLCVGFLWIIFLLTTLLLHYALPRNGSQCLRIKYLHCWVILLLKKLCNSIPNNAFNANSPVWIMRVINGVLTQPYLQYKAWIHTRTRLRRHTPTILCFSCYYHGWCVFVYKSKRKAEHHWITQHPQDHPEVPRRYTTPWLIYQNPRLSHRRRTLMSLKWAGERSRNTSFIIL